MAQITIKKSSVANKVPLSTDLAYGELALNYQDGKLYYKKADNSIDSFLSATASIAGVSSFNTRTGAITLNSTDVTGALGFTPPSVSGTGATGTWGINITGTATALQTARTITIGNTGKTFNGSANVTWSTGEIGAEAQQPQNVPRNNLGDPTVREMALFDGQFNNKIERYDIANVFVETSTDNVTWTPFAITDAQKRILVGGDTSQSTLAIPYGTAYFRIRMRANTYVFLNAFYAYWSGSGHSTTVKVFKKHDLDAGWTAVANSATTVSSWPGHLYLPHDSIPWRDNATQGTHFHEVYVVFQPVWNPSFPSNSISLYKVQWWGGYPAGRRNVYATDEFGNVSFPGTISSAGSLNATGAEISSSTQQQLRLTYGSSIYSDLRTDASGNLNLSATGNFINIVSQYLNMANGNGTILLGAGGFAAGGDIVFRSAGAPSSTINPVFRIKDNTGALQDGLRFNNTWINSTPGSLSNKIDIISVGSTIASITATASSVSTQWNGSFNVTNTLTHAGLVTTDGTNIDQIKTITKSITLTTDWQDTGIKSTDLATGTYMVQLFANDTGSGGTNNNEYYSGTLSWYSGDTNSAMELPTDEITLHRAGGSGDGALYLRTYRTATADPDNLKLQVYSNTANASAANYVFKFRRII